MPETKLRLPSQSLSTNGDSALLDSSNADHAKPQLWSGETLATNFMQLRPFVHIKASDVADPTDIVALIAWLIISGHNADPQGQRFYYTGTEDATDLPTYLWEKDSDGGLAVLNQPSSAAKAWLFASSADVTSVVPGKPTLTEIESWAAANTVTAQHCYYTGSTTNTDPVKATFYVDTNGKVELHTATWMTDYNPAYADFAPAYTYNFAEGVESWLVLNGTLVHDGQHALVATDTSGTDPVRVSSPALTLDPKKNPIIRFALTRVAGTGKTLTIQYQSTGAAAHGPSSAQQKVIGLPDSFVVGNTIFIQADMSQLTAGGADWTNSDSITRIFLFIGDNAATNDSFKLHYFGVGALGIPDTSNFVTKTDAVMSDFLPGQAWNFNSDTQGWTAAANTTLTWTTAQGGAIDVADTGAASVAQIISPATSFSGAKNPRLKLLVTRVAGSTNYIIVRYATSGGSNHVASATFQLLYSLPSDFAVGQTRLLDIDMSDLGATGGTDWITNTISEVRVLFGPSPATDDVMRFHYVAVGKYGAATNRPTVQTVTATTTLTSWNRVIELNISANTNITLPPINPEDIGATIVLRRADTTSATASLVAASGQTYTLSNGGKELNIAGQAITLTAVNSTTVRQTAGTDMGTSVVGESFITKLGASVGGTSNSYTNILSFSVPSAGKWKISYEAVAQVATAGNAITYRVIETAGGTQVTDSDDTMEYPSSTDQLKFAHTFHVSTTQATNFMLQGWGNNTTYTVYTNGTPGRTQVECLKIGGNQVLIAGTVGTLVNVTGANVPANTKAVSGQANVIQLTGIATDQGLSTVTANGTSLVAWTDFNPLLKTVTITPTADTAIVATTYNLSGNSVQVSLSKQTFARTALGTVNITFPLAQLQKADYLVISTSESSSANYPSGEITIPLTSLNRTTGTAEPIAAYEYGSNWISGTINFTAASNNVQLVGRNATQYLLSVELRADGPAGYYLPPGASVAGVYTYKANAGADVITASAALTMVPCLFTVTPPSGKVVSAVSVGGVNVPLLPQAANQFVYSAPSGTASVDFSVTFANVVYTPKTWQVIGEFIPAANTVYDSLASVTTGIDFTKCTHIEAVGRQTSDARATSSFIPIVIGGTTPTMEFQFSSGQMSCYIANATDAAAGKITNLDCHGIAFETTAIRGWAIADSINVVPITMQRGTPRTLAIASGATFAGGGTTATVMENSTLGFVVVPATAGQVLSTTQTFPSGVTYAVDQLTNHIAVSVPPSFGADITWTPAFTTVNNAWTAYTPQLMCTGSGTPAVGAGGVVKGAYCYDANNKILHLNFYLNQMAAGTAGSGDCYVGLPAGFKVNTAIAPTTPIGTTSGFPLGAGRAWYNNGSSAIADPMVVTTSSLDTALRLMIGAFGTSRSTWTSSSHALNVAQIEFAFTAQIPVA